MCNGSEVSAIEGELVSMLNVHLSGFVVYPMVLHSNLWILTSFFPIFSVFIGLLPLTSFSLCLPSVHLLTLLSSWLHLMAMESPQEDVTDCAQNAVLLPDLVEGICVDYLHLKIEKAFFKQVMRYPLGRLGPMQGMEQLQLVVFDETVIYI